MNPNEALRHELSMDAQAQRTASNIDFDFEPMAIDIGERYGAVINYHYLRPNGDHPYPVDAAVTPDSFLRHLVQLSENFTFCRCRDLVDPDLELPESNVVISFDDGARDIIEHAAPVLKRLGIPATFFVCSQPFTEGRLLDVHKIQLLLRKLGLTQFSKAFYAEHARRFPRGRGAERESVAYAGDYQFYRYGSEAMRAFKMDLNYLIPYDQVGRVLDELFRVAFGHDVEASAVREIYLSKDDLKRLVDDGFEVGVHGHDHRVLPRLSYEEQRRNLERAADFLEEEIGQVAKTVAYPYGFFDDDTKRAMNELGFVAGFGMGREIVTPSTIHLGWGIPRFDVVDCFDRETDQIKYEVFSTLSTGD